MNNYKRPEMETDPDKLPGQIVNPIPDELCYVKGRKIVSLGDYVALVKAREGVKDEATSAEYKPAHGGYPEA